MVAERIFRQRALERQSEPESIDAPLRVTAPHEWMISVGLALLLVLALVWGTLGRIELGLRVDGVLVLPGERAVVATAVPGRIVDLLAGPGDSVAAGAPVATLRPAGLEMRLRLARAREARLADAAERSGGADPALRAALEAARVELLELTALQDAGSAVIVSRPGEITAVHVGVGDAVDAGAPIAEVRYPTSGALAAVALLGPRQAEALRPGMAARIHFEPPPDGAAGVLESEVVSVSGPRALPRWLAATPLAASRTDGSLVRLARFSVGGASAPALSDLTPVRLEIVRERVAPLSLLGPVRGGQ